MSSSNTMLDREKQSECATQSCAMNPFEDLMDYAIKYTKERPEVMALTCLGVGFILGWKLKPW